VSRHGDAQIVAVIHGILDVTAFGGESLVVPRAVRLLIQRQRGVLRQGLENALKATRAVCGISRGTWGVGMCCNGSPPAVARACRIQRADTVKIAVFPLQAWHPTPTVVIVIGASDAGQRLRTVNCEHMCVPGKARVGVQKAPQHREWMG